MIVVAVVTPAGWEGGCVRHNVAGKRCAKKGRRLAAAVVTLLLSVES